MASRPPFEAIFGHVEAFWALLGILGLKPSAWAPVRPCAEGVKPSVGAPVAPPPRAEALNLYRVPSFKPDIFVVIFFGYIGM